MMGMKKIDIAAIRRAARLTFHHKNFHGLPCLRGTTQPVSDFGTQQTLMPALSMSALGGEADISTCPLRPELGMLYTFRVPCFRCRTSLIRCSGNLGCK